MAEDRPPDPNTTKITIYVSRELDAEIQRLVTERKIDYARQGKRYSKTQYIQELIEKDLAQHKTRKS